MQTNRRKATLLTLAGGTFNTAVVSIRAVILIPLYLHYIGPHLYGAWLASGDVLVWMQAMDLGLTNLMVQKVGAAYGGKDYKSAGEWFASGVLVLAIASLLILVVGAILSRFVATWFQVSGPDAAELQGAFLLGVVATALTLFNYSFIGLSRAVQDTAFVNGALVVSTLIGFVTSLGLLVADFGLWAIGASLLVQALISVLGSLIFMRHYMTTDMRQYGHVRGTILKQYLRVAPLTGLGTAGYAMINQSLTVLAAIIIRPEAATVLSLTSKAANMGRILVDNVAFAAYGSFAHLVGSPERSRALRVHAEIRALRLALAIVLAAGYLAANSTLVSIWVGPGQYGGMLLTFCFALELIVAGDSFLVNYLYRALGRVAEGSAALFLEGIVRLPLAALLLFWLGMPGGVAAGVLTSLLAVTIVSRRSTREMLQYSDAAESSPKTIWLLRMALLVAGLGVGLELNHLPWTVVFIIAAGLAFGGAYFMLWIDPLTRSTREMVARQAFRLASTIAGRLSTNRGAG